MERERFYFLYVNLNSLAELGLRQMAEQLLAEPVDTGPVEELTEEERDARMLASFENLDLSALDGIGVATGDEATDLEAFPVEPPAFSLADLPADDGEEFDIETYMARAYGFADQLQSRIDHCYRNADLSALDVALLQLPERFSPLTGKLGAADMEQWLELYHEGHEVLGDLATEMRRLDISAGKV